MLLEEKKQFVDEFKKELKESQSCILTNYQGLAVNDITELRSELRKSDCAMKVVKNRLVKRALNDVKNESYEELVEHLKGPTAILLTGKDPSAAVSIFKKYSDDSEFMEFKAGVIGGNTVTKEQLLKLADLPSKQVMLGKVVNVMNAPIQGLHSALSGIVKKFLYALNDLKDKKEDGGISEEGSAEQEKSSDENGESSKDDSAKEEEKAEASEQKSKDSDGEKDEKEEAEEDKEKGEDKNKDESSEEQEGDDGKEKK